MHISRAPHLRQHWSDVLVDFSKVGAEGITPQEDDPMVIDIKIRKWDVKRVLIDPGSSTYVMYWEAFQGFTLDIDLLRLFKGSLVGFSREHVQVKG